MFRILTVIGASLIVLPWHASLSANTDEREEVVGDAIASISVFRAQVQGLQGELQRHRALADAGGWPKVPDGPTIRPDTEDPRVATLARRLAISGDLPDGDTAVSTSDYTETLQNAVRRFQMRHGLEADGLVGRATLRALNVSIEQRIDQIRVNRERVRRLSDSQSDDLVLVNIAAFKAYVIRSGKIVWLTKVIVGEKDDETPEFRSTLKQIVFNPTWTVPRSIAGEEMLPKIKEDPGFFDKGKYQLLDRDGNRIDPSGVEWSAYDIRNFPFTLVQQPGPANQLGQIKFMFPNEYSVCMHDTPAKALFARAARAFSHGCIRVDEPLGFAEVILGSEGWTREQIDSQIESEETTTVDLTEPLPVFVVYWTAEVDDVGVIHFYDDIYGRDATLLRALNRRRRSKGFH
ncbi:MAG: L,D-transpeptidase family protein [Gammaproteobacteria bacterium]|nr:L,D-transpeptidase family protein [Gammaproteobacteria bacterium]